MMTRQGRMPTACDQAAITAATRNTAVPMLANMLANILAHESGLISHL
jgi:hypothetical protein